MRLKRKSQNQNSEQEVQKLIKQLGSRYARDRKRARSRLIEIGEDAVEPLIEALKRKQVRYKMRTLVEFILYALLIMYPIGVALFDLYKPLLISVMVALFLIAVNYFIDPKQSKSSVFKTLIEIEDKRVVPFLVNALGSKSAQVRQDADRKLLPLLLKVDEGDRSLLNSNQRQILYARLSSLLSVYKISIPRVGFAVAAINALQYLGDENALELLKRLALHTNRHRSLEIQLVAEETLAKLKARLEQEKSTKYLLRAGNINDETDTLLRPVDGITVRDNQQLLRSSRDEEQ